MPRRKPILKVEFDRLPNGKIDADRTFVPLSDCRQVNHSYYPKQLEPWPGPVCSEETPVEQRCGLCQEWGVCKPGGLAVLGSGQAAEPPPRAADPLPAEESVPEEPLPETEDVPPWDDEVPF